MRFGLEKCHSASNIDPQDWRRKLYFSADWLLRHGVQRGIEIVSEAARRIPPEVQGRQPQIPCPQIMGIGNVLRHEYHRVSDTLIWNVVQVNLPPLKAAVLAIEAELREGS
jgi:uncharacterized protein with HEPN domain